MTRTASRSDARPTRSAERSDPVAAYGSNEWVISLWLNNDQAAYHWANRVMSQPGIDDHQRGNALQEAFDKDLVEEISDGLLKGIVRDMIQHTQWDEIAEAVWSGE